MNTLITPLVKIAVLIIVIAVVLALQQLDLRYASKTGRHTCDTSSSACIEHIDFLN